MNKKSKLLLIVLTLALLITACANKEEDKNVEKENLDEKEVVLEDENKTVDVLNLAGGDWGYPNPYAHYSRGPGSYKMKLVFDSLLERGPNGMIPWLAKEYSVSEDGLEYIFTLNDEVYWHDNEKLTVDDIIFTINYYKEHPPVSNDLNLSTDNDYIVALEKMDENTLKIVVDKKDATLLEKFGSFRILPKHIWEKVDDPDSFISEESIIGCGPYILTDYNKEQGAYKFKAFDKYYKNILVNEINFIPTSDELLSFESGEIDLTDVTLDLTKQYENNDEIKIVENPAFWGYKLMFNMEKNEEFKDLNLRQAIAYAVNQDELIEKVGRGAGKKASAGYLPVQHSFYNENVKKYEYNIEKSKELLDDNTYEFELLIGNSNPEVRIAEIIKLNLEEIGIKLNVKSIDSKSRDAAIKSGEYDIVLNGHGGWGNDPNILTSQYSTLGKKQANIPGYENDEINRLCKEQIEQTDPEKRKEIIYNLQEVIAEEVPMLPLYNTVDYSIYRPKKYDGYKHVYNHHSLTHNKISFVDME